MNDETSKAIDKIDEAATIISAIKSNQSDYLKIESLDEILNKLGDAAYELKICQMGLE